VARSSTFRKSGGIITTGISDAEDRRQARRAINCGPSQPLGPHSRWMPLACRSWREATSDASSKPRSRGSTHFSNAIATGESQACTCESTTVTAASGRPSPPFGEGFRGGRNAQVSRTRHDAISEPPAVHPRGTAGHRRLATLTSKRLTHTHALAVICLNDSAPATENWAPFVQKLWRTAISCGKPRKSQETTGKRVVTR